MAAAVRLSQSARSWWTISMPCRRASSGRCSAISRPSIRIVPSLGRKLPAIILTSVDLPAPLSPISPTTSPASSVTDTSLTAWMAPKCFEMCSSSSTATAQSSSPGRGSGSCPAGVRLPRFIRTGGAPSIDAAGNVNVPAAEALTEAGRRGLAGRRGELRNGEASGGPRNGRKETMKIRERAGRHGRARASRGRCAGAGQEAAGDRGEGARQPLLRGDQPGLPEVELGERRQRVRVLLHRPGLDLRRGRRGADHPGHAEQAGHGGDRHLAIERPAASRRP